MTTPTTPAGWYPDPDGSGEQRYWDGDAWTERPPPATPSDSPGDDEPAATIPPIPPGEPSAFEPPTFQSFETPTFEEIASGALSVPEPPPVEPEPEVEEALPDTPDSEAPSTAAEELTASEADTPADQWPAQPSPSDHSPSDQAPADETPRFTPQSFTSRTEHDESGGHGWGTGPTPGYGAPTGAGASPGNRRLLVGYLGAVGALLLVLILILLYAFVIRDDETSSTASSAPTTPSAEPVPSTSSETSAPVETEAAPPVEAGAADGPLTFAVTGSEIRTAVTSTVDRALEKTAVGEFVVIAVDVGNTGPDVQDFVSTLQVLKADGVPFPADDQASQYVGGGVTPVDPGATVQTAIVFDVPVGTVPTSIELHGVPGSPGVELPL